MRTTLGVMCLAGGCIAAHAAWNEFTWNRLLLALLLIPLGISLIRAGRNDADDDGDVSGLFDMAEAAGDIADGFDD